MKVVPRINAKRKEETVHSSSQTRICIYELRRARTDHRMLRSATALVKEGFDVSVIDIEFDRSLPENEDILGMHMRHMIVSEWKRSRQFELWFLFVAIRTFVLSLYLLLRTPTDIYHAVEITALPACSIAAWVRRKPLIFEAYELPPPETSVRFWQRLNSLILGVLRMILPHCAGVITTTPLYAQEMCKQFDLAEVVVVRNIPEYCAIQKTDRLRHSLGLTSDTRIALYQGIFQKRRGLDKLVHAAQFLEPNSVIVLMGSGSTTKKELEALIQQKQLSERVKIIPPVPEYRDVPEWTASADIGLLLYPPSHSLSVRFILPNKLFEYIMAGVPVLASQLDAVAEIVDAYGVGQVIASEAPQDIALEINRMLSNREGLHSMHQKTLDAVKELCWEKEQEHLINLYQHVSKKLKDVYVRRKKSKGTEI